MTFVGCIPQVCVVTMSCIPILNDFLSVGAPKPDDEAHGKEHIQDLQGALQRLPRVHLLVLDAFFAHLSQCVSATFLLSHALLNFPVSLIKTTQVSEPDNVYVTKLALSMGRSKIIFVYFVGLGSNLLFSYSPTES